MDEKEEGWTLVENKTKSEDQEKQKPFPYTKKDFDNPATFSQWHTVGGFAKVWSETERKYEIHCHKEDEEDEKAEKAEKAKKALRPFRDPKGKIDGINLCKGYYDEFRGFSGGLIEWLKEYHCSVSDKIQIVCDSKTIRDILLTPYDTEEGWKKQSVEIENSKLIHLKKSGAYKETPSDIPGLRNEYNLTALTTEKSERKPGELHYKNYYFTVFTVNLTRQKKNAKSKGKDLGILCCAEVDCYKKEFKNFLELKTCVGKKISWYSYLRYYFQCHVPGIPEIFLTYYDEEGPVNRYDWIKTDEIPNKVIKDDNGTRKDACLNFAYEFLNHVLQIVAENPSKVLVFESKPVDDKDEGCHKASTQVTSYPQEKREADD